METYVIFVFLIILILVFVLMGCVRERKENYSDCKTIPELLKKNRFQQQINKIIS